MRRRGHVDGSGLTTETKKRRSAAWMQTDRPTFTHARTSSCSSATASPWKGNSSGEASSCCAVPRSGEGGSEYWVLLGE